MPYHGDPRDLDTYNDRGADEEQEDCPSLPWRFGEREWHAVGCQQEIQGADGETIGWIECPQGDDTHARLILQAPAFLSACQGPDADATRLDQLETLLSQVRRADISAPGALNAARALLAALRAAVKEAGGDQP